MTSKYNILIISENYTTSLAFETKEELYETWDCIQKNSFTTAKEGPKVAFFLLDPDIKKKKLFNKKPKKAKK